MHIRDIIKSYSASVAHKNEFQKSERAEIVKKFIDRLNGDRVVAGYKKLPASFYAVKMAECGLKDNFDLYWFYRYCDDSKNFGKTWWWSIKSDIK